MLKFDRYKGDFSLWSAFSSVFWRYPLEAATLLIERLPQCCKLLSGQASGNSFIEQLARVCELLVSKELRESVRDICSISGRSTHQRQASSKYTRQSKSEEPPVSEIAFYHGRLGNDDRGVVRFKANVFFQKQHLQQVSVESIERDPLGDFISQVVSL